MKDSNKKNWNLYGSNFHNWCIRFRDQNISFRFRPPNFAGNKALYRCLHIAPDQTICW